MKRSVYLKITAAAVLIILAVMCLCGCGDEKAQETVPPEGMTADENTGAQELLAAGDYAGAAVLFGELENAALENYKEAASLTAYCSAAAAGEAGDYEACISGFDALGDYKDSRMMSVYYSARQLESKGFGNTDYDALAQAGNRYDDVRSFRDSAERADHCRKSVYDKALSLKEELKYEEAVQLFESAGNYSDAPEMVKETGYLWASLLKEEGSYEQAVQLFESVGDYSDAPEMVKETKYLWASGLRDAGNEKEAVEIFKTVYDYKDVKPYLVSIINADAAVEVPGPKWNVNDTVTFGRYYISTNNDREPIEWTVLDFDEENGRALVISKYGLETKVFHDRDEYVIWADCTLRAWLNGEFMNAAFSEGEKASIVKTEVDCGAAQGSPDYQERNAAGAEKGATEDQLFLLSYAEADKYFPDNRSRICFPTIYAVNQGARLGYPTETNLQKTCFWWLRSPGKEENSELYVNTDGSFGYYFAVNKGNAVRPAMWVDMETEQVIYNSAVSLEKSGHYAEAICVFDGLGEFLDSVIRIDECKEQVYKEAVKLMSAGRYEEAAETFKVCESYKDSAELIEACGQPAPQEQ